MRGADEVVFALSMPEAAKAMGISLRKLEKLVADGEIASVKIGRRRVIRPMAIEDYLRQREAETMEETRQWQPWAGGHD